MAAFVAAQRMGADFLELDVHATADGHVVVLHDFELSRTTSGDGLVHERDLVYVRSLSAGAWAGAEFADERVPLLDEVLALQGIKFEIEVKGLPSPALLDGVAQAIVNAGVADRVLLGGPHHVALNRLATRLPATRIGHFPQPFQPWMTDRLYEQLVCQSALASGCSLVYVPLARLAAVDVARVQRLGLAVQVGLFGPARASSRDVVARALAAGVDGVTTDDPALALHVRAGAGP